MNVSYDCKLLLIQYFVGYTNPTVDFQIGQNKFICVVKQTYSLKNA